MAQPPLILYPYYFKERNDLDGQYDKDLAEIRITDVDISGKKKTESEIKVAFLHELLHAIDATTGHKIFINNENAIEGISELLYQVIIENNILEVFK